MSNRILFKRFSQCVFPTDETSIMKTFSIWSNGNFYYEYKDWKIPSDPSIDDSETKFIIEILKKGKILGKRKLIFQSKELAEKIEYIIKKYKNRIEELPDNMVNVGVFDGYQDYLEIDRKRIWGSNILTNLPYKRSKYFDN